MDFVPTVRRPYVPFYSEVMKTGEADKKEWEKFIGEEYAVENIMQIGGIWFYPRYHLEDFPKRLVKRLLEEDGLFLRMKRESLEREEVFKNSVEKGHEEYFRSFHRYMVTLATYFVCDDVIEETVRQLLEEMAGKEKTEGLMHYLALPLEENYNVKEKIFLIETENPEEHAKKFGWLHSRYGHIKEYSLEDSKKLLNSLKEENFLEKYKKEKEKIRETVKSAKEILGNKKHIIDIMQFFIYYRTQRTDIINMMIYSFAPELEKLAREKGLTYDEALFCTQSEFFNNKIPSKEILKERMGSYSIILDEKGFRAVSGEENRKITEKYLKTSENKKENKEYVEGKTAFGGTVTGTAKIVLELEDLKKIESGDILVTTMTTPNMIPAMHRAAGFVTDEGGITCHASIIARELKKPCVIGTKHATKTFKDGDLIKIENGRASILPSE